MWLVGWYSDLIVYSRYDKNKESGVKDKQSHPVGSHVKEEFNNRYIENKEYNQHKNHHSFTFFNRIFLFLIISVRGGQRFFYFKWCVKKMNRRNR